MDEALANIISSVGVPAAISFYLLIRVSKSLDQLTEVIVRLDTRLEERERREAGTRTFATEYT